MTWIGLTELVPTTTRRTRAGQTSRWGVEIIIACGSGFVRVRISPGQKWHHILIWSKNQNLKLKKGSFTFSSSTQFGGRRKPPGRRWDRQTGDSSNKRRPRIHSNLQAVLSHRELVAQLTLDSRRRQTWSGFLKICILVCRRTVDEHARVQDVAISVALLLKDGLHRFVELRGTWREEKNGFERQLMVLKFRNYFTVSHQPVKESSCLRTSLTASRSDRRMAGISIWGRKAMAMTATAFFFPAPVE